MQKKLYTLTPVFLFSYILLQVLLGVAILNGWLILALPVSGLLFGLHRAKPRLRLLVSAVFLGNIAFMMTVISWFRNIDAFGWQNIGPFSPNLILMFALFIASFFCSIFVTTLWFLTGWLIRKTVYAVASLSYIYVWGLLMMLTEIVRTTSFSLFVTHSQAPIEPSLNLFSAGPLVIDTPLSPLSRLAGFWGSSFLVFALSGLLYMICNSLLKHRGIMPAKYFNTRRVILVVSVVTVAYGISGVTFGKNQDTADSFNVVAVSQARQDTAYLQRLAEQLPSTDIDETTVIVLPEYSNLFHPYSDASLFNPTYDGRETFPALLSGKRVYFVGTEDELSENGRYVETYIADSSLRKIKRAEKTFLIPGGEYIPPLVGSAVKRIDSSAVINFTSSRSRKVLKDDLPADDTDPVARSIATGPCSAILTPFHFRKQAADGAVLLTSNVSYEQFSRAPEYSEYARRFARFTAYSTARPFIIGARAGEAMIYGTSGEILARSGDGLTASYGFENLSHKKNPYVILGDTIIVGLFTLAGLLIMKAYRLLPHTLLRRNGKKKR